MTSTTAPAKARKKPNDPTIVLANTADELTGALTLSFEEGTTEELARRLELATRIKQSVNDIIDVITESLAARMEDDVMTIAGVGTFTRKRRMSSAWIDDDARERMYDDTARAIIEKVAVDPMTGEIHPPLANAVRQTWKLVQESFSLGADPKAGFRKSLGLQPDIYRSKYATGYTVSVGEETF